ncbi:MULTISPECIES: hypothetical protein [Gordonibacter]|uniref:Uncharacterized protein n=1 Tax=Gordonibacter massiliensis (ex Traore et al. 2017) TaxID=1841863 RepID=A0A842JGN9_9ACTN|nr:MULTISPECIES: hypothetical protein [Gordonibacter]MBC2889058.1 hypothetical protein [Gordonibacter massiliensis (ex Traore et al. 2017)]MBX9035161.1 hypothetical protein [Gordonibacter massiliensis (ex Traore et al. 2017)]RDB63355.1 hypothetical protein C1878_05730 [Gordonibacter sp. 28C]
MDRDAIFNMSMQERIEYFNGRLAGGESYEDILASVGLTKKEAGQSEPYGLGLIKLGNEVKPKPGRGENGFAW